MIMKTKLFLIAFVFAAFSGYSQENNSDLKRIGNLESMVQVPSLASRINELEPANIEEKEAQDGRSLRAPKKEVVPGKGNQKDVLSENPHELTGKIQGRVPSLVFDAVFTNSQPTDPTLAVGPNHVFVVFNTGFAIFDKDGVELVAPSSPNSIFNAGGCCDLTVSYDPTATSASNPAPGRWVLSFLVGLNAGARIAVSQGPDPVNDGWNVYFAPQLRDYNKLSVYGAGYFMADNDFSFPLVALERQAMLDGEPAGNVSIQQFALPGYVPQNFIGHQILNVTDDYIPSLQNVPIVYQQDDSFGGVATDHVKFWNATIDFDVPANSSVSAAQQIDVSPYTGTFDGGSFANLDQPNGGGFIDALQGITMNQAQFRKFPTYNSAVFNHVIDVDPTGGKLAAIRWYEFRQTTEGQPWTLEQEGTYTSPDGKHAWNASLMMDEQGNIGMGYSAMNGDNDVFVSSYYTGRFANDPAGTMTIGEELIAQGGGNVPSGQNRYGDYSKIDIDPNDDQTFWFITEYISPGNGRADVVGRFKIAPDAVNDTGVIAIVQPESGALSSTESVEITVRNFGVMQQSNVPVSFTVNGITVNEVVPGPILPSTNVSYTFIATADLGVDGETYTINACTNLVGDEDIDNNCVDKTVVHLNDNDTGVVSIDTPNTGNVLTAAEDVTISIQNFGALEQTNIPVFYSINGVITSDMYPGPLAIGETDTFTFGTPADLSVIGVYTIISGTELVNDADETNDDITKIVENIEGYCLPTVTTVDPDNADSGCNLDGIKMFVLNTISADDGEDGCNTEPADGPKGYSDRTNLSTIVSNQAGSNDYILQAQVNWNGAIGVEALSAWIDFNDDLVFDETERLISGEFFSVFGELNDFDLVIPVGANLGSHVLRVKAIDTSSDGDILDPCSDYAFGETQDYTVEVQDILGLDDSNLISSDFTVTTLPNNQFEVNLNMPSTTEKLALNVYSVLGQNLAYYVLEYNGAGYNKIIDMSYVASGVYFIEVLTSERTRKVHRIIVQ